MFVWLHQRFVGDGLVEVLEFFEFYDSEGVMTTKLFSELQFHLLENADFESMIAEVGFDVVEIYGDYAYAPFDETKSPVMGVDAAVKSRFRGVYQTISGTSLCAKNI